MTRNVVFAVALTTQGCHGGGLVLFGKDILRTGCRRSPFQTLPYRRMRLHAGHGGALVVCPGMLFPNSCSY